MLCSTPVLSSNVAFKKIINDCGFVMDNNDSETILTNLVKTINIFMNKKVKMEISSKKITIRDKQNFSIENMSNTYLKKWIL